MTTTHTIDVWCDHRDCDQWTDGVTRRGVAARERDARHQARIRGWTRRRVDDLMVDLCPEHSTYTAADRAFLDAAKAEYDHTPRVSVFDLAAPERGWGSHA